MPLSSAKLVRFENQPLSTREMGVFIINGLIRKPASWRNRPICIFSRTTKGRFQELGHGLSAPRSLDHCVWQFALIKKKYTVLGRKFCAIRKPITKYPKNGGFHYQWPNLQTCLVKESTNLHFFQEPPGADFKDWDMACLRSGAWTIAFDNLR